MHNIYNKPHHTRFVHVMRLFFSFENSPDIYFTLLLKSHDSLILVQTNNI